MSRFVIAVTPHVHEKIKPTADTLRWRHCQVDWPVRVRSGEAIILRLRWKTPTTNDCSRDSSEAKVSQVVSRLAENEQIEKIRIGRENLLQITETDPQDNSQNSSQTQ